MRKLTLLLLTLFISLTVLCQQKSHDLEQVTINGFTNTLIRKAISNIPINYGSKPYIQNGMLRIYNIVNDSDYFFKGDAMVQTYFPIFKFNTNTEPQTRIISNERTEYKSPNFESEDLSMGPWVGGYLRFTQTFLFNPTSLH